MASQTLLTNARIFTGLSDSLSATDDTLLISNGKIEHVGATTDQLIVNVRKSGVREQDVQGRIVCPGFIDSHMHILLFGQSLLAIDLERCRTLEDVRQTIRKGAKANSKATRLICVGWTFHMTNDLALASDLDDLDPRPIFIYAKDLHSAWCNTIALEEMGVDDMGPVSGGEIRRDDNGKPSGLMSEAAAINVVWPYLARVVTKEEKLSQIRDAIGAYNAAGYTGMIEMATDEEIWSLLSALRAQEGPLTIRIACHWLIRPCKTNAEHIEQVERAIALHREYNLQTSPDLRIAGIKIIGDGVIDACTASLLEPYTSNASNVDPIWPYATLLPVVRHADAAGLQCALHAIGDNTVRTAVDVLSTIAAETGVRDRRHRIEHLELTSPHDARRLGELGITASIQPVHADPSILRAWPSLIGPERVKRAFAYSEFAEGGARLAIGTDSPTAPHLPFRNLYVGTTRRSAREETMEERVNVGFKLGVGQAMRAATSDAAKSCFADARVGTLEVGKQADLIICDLDWDAERLLEAVIQETWVEGRPVFTKAA